MDIMEIKVNSKKKEQKLYKVKEKEELLKTKWRKYVDLLDNIISNSKHTCIWNAIGDERVRMQRKYLK